MRLRFQVCLGKCEAVCVEIFILVASCGAVKICFVHLRETTAATTAPQQSGKQRTQLATVPDVVASSFDLKGASTEFCCAPERLLDDPQLEEHQLRPSLLLD